MVVFNLNGQYEFKQPMYFDSQAACQEDAKLFGSIKIPKEMVNRVKYHHALTICVHSESNEEFENNMQAVLDLPKGK